MTQRIPVEEATPQEVWEDLASDPWAQLVDVRTIAEWDYVGVPLLDSLNKDLLKVEWMCFPENTVNTYFAEELLAQLGPKDPTTLYFLCRSGKRSLHGARKVLEKLEGTGRSIRCVNVIEGFEGDHDENRQRGRVNGWKVRGLPWSQS